MGGSIGEHVWRQSYKMSTSKVTNGANLKKCQLLMSTSTVILARILQSVNFAIYRYILGNTDTGVCSDIGNTNTSIHPVSYCPIWEEAVLIPDLIMSRVPVTNFRFFVTGPSFSQSPSNGNVTGAVACASWPSAVRIVGVRRATMLSTRPRDGRGRCRIAFVRHVWTGAGLAIRPD